MSATSLYKGLGEHRDVDYLTVMSNSNVRNTNSSFDNTIYGGVHFFDDGASPDDRQWSVALTNTSIPRHDEHRKDALEHDIWFKRLHIGEELPTDNQMYKKLYAAGILNKDTYANQMNSMCKIRPRPDIAKKIVEVWNQTFPTELEHFLEFQVWLAPYGLYDTAKGGLQRTHTYLGIKPVPTSKSPVTTDTFDIDIRRDRNITGGSNTRASSQYAISDNEGGYYQIVRLSRTLAMLLGIDDWKDKDYFPKCDWSAPLPAPKNIVTGINDKLYARAIAEGYDSVLTFPSGWWTFENFRSYLINWTYKMWPSICGGHFDVTTQGKRIKFIMPHDKNFTLNFETTATHNCRDLLGVNAGKYDVTFVGQNDSPFHVTPIHHPDSLLRLTDFGRSRWSNSGSTSEATFMTEYISKLVATPRTIEPWGVTGAKLFASNRSFFVTILKRTYDKNKDTYGGADLDAEKKVFSVLPDIHSPTTTTSTGGQSDDGQYVDLLIGICDQSSSPAAGVFSSADIFYNDPSKYKTQTILQPHYLPLPINSSIDDLYIPRGIPYTLSEYIRDVTRLSHTVIILSPTLVYENATCGRLDNTLECLQTPAPTESVSPWTKQWFQIRRPIINTLRKDIFGDTFQFRIEIEHGASAMVQTLNKLSSTAKAYYSNNSVLMLGSRYPVALTLLFMKI